MDRGTGLLATVVLTAIVLAIVFGVRAVGNRVRKWLRVSSAPPPAPPKPTSSAGDADHVRAQIELAVRAGFADDAALEQLVDEVGTEPASVYADLLAYGKALLARKRKEEATWTELTMNDRIDRAFAELAAAGVVALQDTGMTKDAAWYEIEEVAKTRSPPPRGGVYYHGQDLETAVAGEGLYIGFRAFDDTKTLAIGRDLDAALQRHGVKTTWNGTIDDRIFIPPFTWQKRQFTKPPR